MKTRSFTLIELLIVLVIIGVVVTLAVPRYQSFVIRMRGAEAMSNVRAIADASWGYYLEAGKFPVQIGGVPSCLDVKIPDISGQAPNYVSTGNFVYNYEYYEGTQVQSTTITILAIDLKMSYDRIVGEPAYYAMVYRYDCPVWSTYWGTQNGEKMSDNWYRYTIMGFATEDPATNLTKWGWPGGK